MAGILCRLRLAAQLLRARGGTAAASGVRRASSETPLKVYYRQFPEQPRSVYIKGDMILAFMWFWILWHTWHEPEELLGHFPYPDASKWTDEELGIPPDDYDE